MNNITCDETQPLTKDEIVELVAKFRAGDDAAGWRLVLSVRGWMINIVSRNVNSEAEGVEDACSELSLLLFKSLRNYDPDKSPLTSFVHTIWSRRRSRILSRCLSNYSGDTSDLGELDVTVCDELEDVTDCSVIDELAETSELTEVAKFAFRLKAREENRAQIVRKIEHEYPGYFTDEGITNQRDRENHVGELITEVALLLGEQFDYRQLTVRLADTSNEQFASAMRLLFDRHTFDTHVRAFRRLGICISSCGIQGLQSRFEIDRRIRAVEQGESINEHIAEIVRLRVKHEKKPKRKDEPMAEIQLTKLADAPNEQYASAIRILFNRQPVNAYVRALRRLGILVSHRGVYGLLSQFEIDRRINAIESGESIDTHIAEILNVRHEWPKKERKPKPPKAIPELREIEAGKWEEIVQLLPPQLLKPANIRQRVSALVQKRVDGLSWQQVAKLVDGGNLRALYEILTDLGLLGRIIEIATPSEL